MEWRARRGTAGRHNGPASLALAILLAAHGPSFGESLEGRVKAGFVVNFPRFIEWKHDPLEGQDGIRIGILGESVLATPLAEAVRSQTVKGSRLELLEFSDPSAIRPCHILVVGEDQVEGLAEILRRPELASTLVVSEMQGFVERGGEIQLVKVGGRVRFDINRGALREANLRASSRLLRQARRVLD
jgi:hypothetical protein